MITEWERRTVRTAGERAELVIEDEKVRCGVPNW